MPFCAANFEKFTGVEKDALRTYTGSSYRRWNGYLRGTRSDLRPGEAEQIEAAKQALSKSAFERPAVLRRGTDLGDLAGLIGAKDFDQTQWELEQMSASKLNKLYANTIGEYKGFTSTSSMWDKGFSGPVEVVFYAPEGTQASSIMGISQFGTAEGETLLNAGTQVRILRIEESDGHMSSSIRMYLEILP